MRYLYNSGNRYETVVTNNNVHHVITALTYLLFQNRRVYKLW